MLDVVVVHYKNTEEDLNVCLSSVRRYLSKFIQSVTIVCNGHSSVCPAGAYPWARWIEAPQNLGFGRAVNLGVSSGSAPYLLMLNPDAELTTDWVSHSIEILEDNPRLAAVAPMVENTDGSLQSNCGMIPNALSVFLDIIRINKWGRILANVPSYHLSPKSNRPPQWLSGVSFVMRRTTFAEVHGFAESYFMYMEDVDLFYRLRVLGKGCLRLPTPGVLHKGGGHSTVTSIKFTRESWAVFCRATNRDAIAHYLGLILLWVGAMRIRKREDADLM